MVGARNGHFRPIGGLFRYSLPDFTALAATTERVVVNRYSGLAIGGFEIPSPISPIPRPPRA